MTSVLLVHKGFKHGGGTYQSLMPLSLTQFLTSTLAFFIDIVTVGAKTIT